MGSAMTTKTRHELRVERRSYYCAICEPDANDKQGTDHRTGDHDAVVARTTAVGV
jgi:hypothetical protein